jgi:hypothetical protein
MNRHLRRQIDPETIALPVRSPRRNTVKRWQLAAYADPRAYTDRLNEVFGKWGWTRDYTVQVVQNFERRAEHAVRSFGS